jgi:hypothetical protein
MSLGLESGFSPFLSLPVTEKKTSYILMGLETVRVFWSFSRLGVLSSLLAWNPRHKLFPVPPYQGRRALFILFYSYLYSSQGSCNYAIEATEFAAPSIMT